MNTKCFERLLRVAIVAVIWASMLALALAPTQSALAQGPALSYGQSVTSQITASTMVVWHDFHGTAGDLISISMDNISGDLDPYLDLWFYNGVQWQRLIDDDDSGGNRNALIFSYVLPYTGNYTIGAHRYADEYGTTVGSYRLTLTSMVGASGFPENDSDLDDFTAVLEITGFNCYDGEEDDYFFSSGEDEITFIYTIIETDQYGRAIRSSSHGWGPYDVHAGDGYNSQYFEDITLSRIPVGHGLVVTLTIVEIEDYSKAQNTIDEINKKAEYVEIANSFNPEPYSKAAIEILGEVLFYTDIALDVVDWADDDDILADQVDVGDPNLVHSTLLGGGQLHNGWVFSGENNTDDFKYEVDYVVHLQPTYR